jgi:hypothetical protein
MSVPSLSIAVNFHQEYIGKSSTDNNDIDYWVVTGSDVKHEGVTYDLGGLYHWEDGAWVKVASVADNALSRAMSVIKQTADSIAFEVTDVKEDVVQVKGSIDETIASVQTLASWAGQDGKRNLATIEQTADDGGARMALVVVKDTEGGEDISLGGASIILDDGEKGSYIEIEADNIIMTGTTTFLQPDDVGENGKTVINGGRIDTNTITADKLKIDGIDKLISKYE